MPNEPHTFLQIYFMGGEDSESALANSVDACCRYNNLNSPFSRLVVGDLNSLLNEHNELLKLFKSLMHKLQSDNHDIIINSDKTPNLDTFVDSMHLLLTELLNHDWRPYSYARNKCICIIQFIWQNKI
ncbi:unnamed protein product [Macrosiphum euphorbiae]|uniref:Uncharacterized protein n=1 Tax=Macrosiphum euphorbiae TaxID=13131 RepID=A0AAV0VL72_9HEMI|nr:unnamed protein product [Macrosiphum euphorbiae]